MDFHPLDNYIIRLQDVDRDKIVLHRVFQLSDMRYAKFQVKRGRVVNVVLPPMRCNIEFARFLAAQSWQDATEFISTPWCGGVDLAKQTRGD